MPFSSEPALPVVARFRANHDGHVPNERLSSWERSMFEKLPNACPPRWPTESISGSDDCWDDCDE